MKNIRWQYCHNSTLLPFLCCLQALKDGDSLMDSGKLKEALAYYEKIMNKLPFQVTLSRNRLLFPFQSLAGAIKARFDDCRGSTQIILL